MRILLDVDGVLADLTTHFAEWLQNAHGIIVGECREWDFSKAWGIPKALEDAYFETVGCRHTPEFPGAQEFLRTLQAKHEVWACTAAALPQWYGDRSAWLQDFGIPGNRQIICGRKAKAFVRADALIDDKPENLIGWAKTNPDGFALLFDQPWNRDFRGSPGVERVYSYSEILGILL